MALYAGCLTNHHNTTFLMKCHDFSGKLEVLARPAQRGRVRQWQPGRKNRCGLWWGPESPHVDTPSGRRISRPSGSSNSDLLANYSTSLQNPCLPSPSTRAHVYHMCVVPPERKYNPRRARKYSTSLDFEGARKCLLMDYCHLVVVVALLFLYVLDKK